ncbi:MAG TPA: endonuclease/exonuclease/phosphatase family protein [Burkholderiales bacterium]|nr:endonuclease/exonuclease/phosphatase family protein [Burkholderiales bacterium]
MAASATSLANWRALDARLGPDCLRIASYNVHGCVGSDRRSDPARVAEVIGETGCDTIGLQEVHHAGILAERTGLQLIEGAPHMWHDRHVGNALLTRRRVLEVRHHEYGWTGCEPRSALDVELEVNGDAVRVIVTHLGLKPVERRYQVGKILEMVKKSPLDKRVLVLGDINEWLPLGRPLRWLHALLGHSPSERSFPARWPLFALDRVWVRPRHALLAFGVHRSPLAAQASDHLPVKAIVAAHDAKRNGPVRARVEEAVKV